VEGGIIRIVENHNFTGLLRQVLNERIGGAYLNPLVAANQLEIITGKRDALLLAPDLPITRGTYELSTIAYPDVLEDLRKFLRENEEAVESLKREYGL
jgi:hypothetical protein